MVFVRLEDFGTCHTVGFRSKPCSCCGAKIMFRLLSGQHFCEES